MKSESFPELEQLIDHLVYINKENWIYLAESEMQQQKLLYGRITNDVKIKWYLKNHLIEVLFWEST